MVDKTTVLMVGVTGMLGSQIAEALLNRDAIVRVLTRSQETDPAKQQRLDALTEKGLQAIAGDLLEPDSLPNACTGVDVIISAVQGNETVMIQGQQNLIKAAESAGVPRMIPSDFAVDISKLDYGDNFNLDLRKKADEAFQNSSVQPTSIFNGAFIDVMIQPFFKALVDWDEGIFNYWGDGNQLCDFTTVADTALYTAAAAIDRTLTGRPLRIAGNVLTMKQLHQAFEAGSGRKLAARSLGSVADLKAEIDRRKQTASNPWDWISLQYLWCMVSGKGKLEPIDNSRYPHIHPTSVTDFVAQTFAKQLQTT
jgi:nucleoside-diphosphate-sugar epimerase